MRTFDSTIVLDATDQVKNDLKGMPPELWLADYKNIALTNAAGDVALFEYRGPGIYCGHYFFHSRGRDAVLASEEFLSEIFLAAKVIIGFTPLDKKGALWLTRRLGFQAMEDTDIDGRPHRISILTKQSWEGKK